MNGADGGVFIYHPLMPGTPLHRLYGEHCKGRTGALIRAAEAGDSAWASLPPDSRSKLLRRYRQHLRPVLQRRGLAADGQWDDTAFDSRALVGRFRRLFRVLAAQSALPGEATGIAVLFPAIDCFDNRCLEMTAGGTLIRAVLVTSRTLDAIEFLCRTLALATRLDGLALQQLLGMEDPPPAYIALAWMTMSAPAQPDVLRLHEVATATPDLAGAALRRTLYEARLNDWCSAEYRRALGHYRLATSLTWLGLGGLNAMVRNAQPATDRFVGLKGLGPVPAPDTRLGFDSEYLATALLTFVVMHEIGHLVLGHNRPEGAPEDPTLIDIAEATRRFAEASGDDARAHNLIGTPVGHETAADQFAFQVVDADCLDPLLEAATLWCAALAGTNEDCGDWLAHHEADPRGRYPAYAMRVWYLNGRFSGGLRQGEIAREITRRAESLAGALDSAADNAAERVELFERLWDLGLTQCDLGGAGFRRWLRRAGD